MLHAVAGRIFCVESNGKWSLLRNSRPPAGHSNSLQLLVSALEEMSVITAPFERSEFPAQFRGRKRSEYERAVRELEVAGLDASDATIRMFLKHEKDVRSEKPNRIPRVISPPSTKFLVELGRYVKKVEHGIYENVDRIFGFDVVVKGRNAAEVGQIIDDHWHSFADPVAIDCDVEKLDRSFDGEMLHLTHRPIMSCFQGSDLELVRRLLKTQLKPIVKGRMDDGFFSYTVDGTLTSGQPNTSLAGVVAVCAIIYEWAKGAGIRVKVVDAGDDFTIFCEKKDEQRVWQGLNCAFRDHGFILTRSPTRHIIEEIEFCQCHPVRVDGSYRLVRNARSAAIKDAGSTKPIDQVGVFCGWVNAVGNSGISMHSGVPVAQSYYDMMIRSAHEQVNKLTIPKRKMKKIRNLMRRFELEDGGLKWWSAGMTGKSKAIAWETRVSYYLAFGITPLEQTLLEKHYDTTTIKYSKNKVPVDWNIPVHLWG